MCHIAEIKGFGIWVFGDLGVFVGVTKKGFSFRAEKQRKKKPWQVEVEEDKQHHLNKMS